MKLNLRTAAMICALPDRLVIGVTEDPNDAGYYVGFISLSLDADPDKEGLLLFYTEKDERLSRRAAVHAVLNALNEARTIGMGIVFSSRQIREEEDIELHMLGTIFNPKGLTPYQYQQERVLLSEDDIKLVEFDLETTSGSITSAFGWGERWRNRFPDWIPTYGVPKFDVKECKQMLASVCKFLPSLTIEKGERLTLSYVGDSGMGRVTLRLSLYPGPEKTFLASLTGVGEDQVDQDPLETITGFVTARLQLEKEKMLAAEA